MVDRKSEDKIKMKSLAEELREKIARESSLETEKIEESDESLREKKSKKKIEDISDKEIQEISKKITKKDIEEEKKSISPKEETLIPLEDYIKCAVHLGTKVITPHMRKYVYKRRADGLAVINTLSIDKKLREAIEFLLKYETKQVYLCCKREAGWQAARKFEEATGIIAFTKKYSPGITTNLKLENFFESDLAIICDPWIDKNALKDTKKLKKPVMGLCDTNNYTFGVDHIIPCNNKSGKSIGCILYILAREYCKRKKMQFNYRLEEFTGELE